MERATTSHEMIIRRDSEDRFDLGALFEFSANINATFDVAFILNHFLLTIMGKIISPRGVILLQAGKNMFNLSTFKGLPDDVRGKTVKIGNIPNRLLYVRQEDGRKMPWIRFFKTLNMEFVIPLTVQDRPVGYAAFGSLIPGKILSEKEETYVLALSNIAAAAIEKGLMIAELKTVNRRLDAKVQELNTLFELSKEFNVVLETERLMKLLTYSLLGQLGVNKFFIAMRDTGGMKIVQSRLTDALPESVIPFLEEISAPVQVRQVKNKKHRSILERFDEAAIRLLVPLQLHHETKGVIGVGDRMNREPYTQPDIEFLSSLGNLAIISLENARLFREAIEKQRLEDDLLIARDIQKRLLPEALPHIAGYDIAATNVSSKQVGGDYYDVISLDEGRYVIAIGDVSGKGTPASLLMANLQATIRALVPLGLPLSELTGRVNDLICENTGSDRFITFFWGILDAANHSLHYVSAGHNPPYVFHQNGIVERLDKGGMILGVMKTLNTYQSGDVRFEPNDVLILFTDGVSEAMSAGAEEFGEPKLEEVSKANLALSAENLLATIVTSVREHSKGTTQSDDITMIVLKRIA